jgi:prephenate dehydrogenase
MAGRERSGAAAGSADLFTGRPWVEVATAETGWEAQRCARDLATDLGAGLVQLDAEAHDQAVALVSHVPQVLSSLVAARLAAAPEGALDLAGQGLRDTTRIAASDPNLWAAILAGNGPAVAEVLRAVAADLDRALAALEGGASPDNLGKAVVALTDLIAAGNAGVRRIPGKHGGAKRRFDKVTVMVPDQPGELGRLFQEMGRLGVNLEDLRLEHGAGQLVGMAEISVAEGAGAKLMEDLETQGWRILR